MYMCDVRHCFAGEAKRFLKFGITRVISIPIDTGKDEARHGQQQLCIPYASCIFIGVSNMHTCVDAEATAMSEATRCILEGRGHAAGLSTR